MPVPAAMVAPDARVMLPLPPLPAAVRNTLPAPLIGALTLIARYALSVNDALGLVQLMAALTLMSPTPLGSWMPSADAPVAVVDSTTLVPLFNAFEMVVAAVLSIVRSYGSTSHVPALPFGALALIDAA